VGLLLLSVSAATTLAEERVRGSLDVLLSTPLSTFSILVGKWWGAFRLMPHVLLWPALTTSFLVVDSGRWIRYLLLIGLITVYGAAIASLGLAVATWQSRLGPGSRALHYRLRRLLGRLGVAHRALLPT
jgi:ABC-type Na+ efflux pump permease subunit